MLTCGNPILGRNLAFRSAMCNVTLKIKSMSSESNQLFSFSQQCIYAKSFTGSEDDVRKQSYTDACTDADGIHTKTNMSPLDWGWWDINIKLLIYVNLKSVHMTYLHISLLMEYVYL